MDLCLYWVEIDGTLHNLYSVKLTLFTDKYTTQDVRFEWREVATWQGLVGAQRTEFRLPKYVVSFVTDKSNQIRNFGEGKCIFIALRFCLRLVND